MLEFCTVEMDQTKKLQLKEAIVAFDAKAPVFDVSDLNLSIKVLVNTPGIDNQYLDIEQAWSRWFKKLGVANFRFYTEDPKLELPIYKKIMP